MNKMRNMLLILLSVFSMFFYFYIATLEAFTINYDYPFRNYYKLSDFGSAALNIQKAAIEKNPMDYEKHFVLGYLYILTDDTNKAKGEFESVIKLKSDHFLGYIILGYLTELNKNQQNNATSYFKKALLYAPKEPMIYNSIASVYMRQNDFVQALSILEDGIKLVDDESLLFNQTLILMKYFQGQKEQERIVRNMIKAIKLFPRAEYYFIYGVYCLQMQNFDGAKMNFEKVIELNPNDVVAILALATAYKKTDHYEKAINLGGKALAIDPNNKDIQNEVKEYEDAFKIWKESKGVKLNNK